MLHRSTTPPPSPFDDLPPSDYDPSPPPPTPAALPAARTEPELGPAGIFDYIREQRPTTIALLAAELQRRTAPELSDLASAITVLTDKGLLVPINVDGECLYAIAWDARPPWEHP